MANFKSVAQEIRKAAAAYPGSYEESPWGELVAKVKGKVFVFLGRGDEAFGISVKLPTSSGLALGFPFASPTGYGLGKSGWISARFEKGEDVPTGLLLEWIDESYRAIAPKTLVKELDGEKKPPGPSKEVAKKKKKKPARSAGKVLIVSDDELRLERARKAIEEAGLGTVLASGIDDVFAHLKKKLRAAVVDLGRRPNDALEVAYAIGQTPLFFAGARDAATVKKARHMTESVRGAFREPPGDPKVVAGLAVELG